MVLRMLNKYVIILVSLKVILVGLLEVIKMGGIEIEEEIMIAMMIEIDKILVI